MDQRTQRLLLEKTLDIAVDKILEAEKQLDDAIEHLDHLSADEIGDLRRRRKAEYEKSQKKKAENLKLGHGKYTEVHDQLEWFEACKESGRVITHFYRPTTQYCILLDTHLEKLAAQHLEARFIKINAEKAPFLAERLEITIMPTIIATNGSKVIDTIEGFTDLGNTDKFSTETLRLRLGKRKGIDYDDEIAKSRLLREEQMKKDENGIRQSELHNARAKLVATIDDDDDDWLNDE